MPQQTKRIDAGIKRGPRMKPAKLPHLKLKPSDVENESRALARAGARDPVTGRLISLYTPEVRQNAVDDALASLELGETVLDVAKRHNIPVATVKSWLIADNRPSEARTIFYSREISGALEILQVADTPLALARGRELHRAWITTAAVRDNANFGQKQEVTVINADLGDRLRRARERTIEHEPASDAVLLPTPNK